MRKDLILIAILIAILALMVIPLSQGIIDVLIAVNLSLSVLLLMVAIYLRHPSDFSTFPSVILIGTAFRLALSVGTTRLILSEADAGQIIETFGDFVVAGSVAIGMVIFLIITVVQFLVVTKGAERVAEVGARFALDAMPGKQMAIDAELRAGAIDGDEAAAQRRRLDKDSQFFGAMDGAMKFVKGDAIAGLIIICINLIGGVAVGLTLHGLSFGEAIAVFSLLTVGDGLVAQIPALLMSLCAGVIVTRVAGQENDDLGTDIAKELVADPRVPMVAAAVVLGMGFVPGFPTVIFAVAASVLLASSLALRARLRLAGELAEEPPDAVTPPAAPTYPVSDRVALLLSPEVAALAPPVQVADALIPMFEALREARGPAFPRPDVIVDETVGARSVVVMFDQVPIFRSQVPEGHVPIAGEPDLVIAVSGPDETARVLDWPGLHGVWGAEAQRDRFAQLGIEEMPLDAALAKTAFRLTEHNLGLMFDNRQMDGFLAAAEDREPEAMKAIGQVFDRGALTQIVRALVEDGVPLRPIGVLISGLQHCIHMHGDPAPMLAAEAVRTTMKRQLCHRIAGPDGFIGVAMLDPSVEGMLRRCVADARRVSETSFLEGLVLKPAVSEALALRFRDLAGPGVKPGQSVAVVVAADLRWRLRNWLSANGVHLPVLSVHELASEVRTVPLELISLPATLAPKAGTPRPRAKPLPSVQPG